MVPCIDDNIPVYVRNIFNPAFKGTVVQGRSPTLKDKEAVGKTVNWRSKKVRNCVARISSQKAFAYFQLS